MFIRAFTGPTYVIVNPDFLISNMYTTSVLYSTPMLLGVNETTTENHDAGMLCWPVQSTTHLDCCALQSLEEEAWKAEVGLHQCTCRPTEKINQLEQSDPTAYYETRQECQE